MKTKRGIILVLDGFGVGVMNDYQQYNPQDEYANTFQNLLVKNRNLKLPNLKKLGLWKVLPNPDNMSPLASYGTAKLNYPGADSYFGHQEIMGSIIQHPQLQRLQDHYIVIGNALKKKTIKLSIIIKKTTKSLL